MESRINIQLSYNGKNIKKNLFSKPHPNTEAKPLQSKEKEDSEKKLILPKSISSYIYYRKIPKLDDKNYHSIKSKKIYIDSLSEVRLPLDFIDLSYDDHKKKG